MPRDTRLPPLASDGVFAVTGSSIIDAPRQKVWDILMDFDSYAEWNSFVRGQRVTTASGTPTPSTAPHEGAFLSIAPVHLPPTLGTPGLFGTSSAFVEITVLDHERFRAAWETAGGGVLGWLLRTERWQMLEEVEVEGGGKKTRYETIEVFAGPLAYVVRLLMGAKLGLGFQAMADTLKERAERRD